MHTLYGSKEFAFASPFADGLVASAALREWVLGRTKFKDRAAGARLLHEEMKAKRNSTASTWWRSHFTQRCDCPGCKGKETDLLAIFEDQAGFRFALHIEVKQPTDVFKKGGGQAAAYRCRAACWATPERLPTSIPEHKDAATALLCSRAMTEAASEDVRLFDAVFCFEEITKHFGIVFPASPKPTAAVA